jgi:DNA-binding NarL/FixJ family response regulator
MVPSSASSIPFEIVSKTVGNYVSNIFTKLQVSDRAQAIIRARDAGLG